MKKLLGIVNDGTIYVRHQHHGFVVCLTTLRVSLPN